jgi:hypothetical protein
MYRNMTMVFVACLLIHVTLIQGAEAETPSNDARVFGIFAPKPGAWSEYAIIDKATGKQILMHLSITGAEEDSYWYEVLKREGGTSNVVKMLLKGDPYNSENIQRLIQKSGKNSAREIDREILLRDRGTLSQIFEELSGIPATANLTLQNHKKGEGVVTVPAGMFDVGLHQIVDTTGKVYVEYTFSEEVRPFGIVTSDGGNRTMVLVGYGTGASSRITEEPTMITRSPAMADQMPTGMEPGMSSPQSSRPAPGSNIRQLPGMGTGYEPRQQQEKVLTK